VALAQLAVDTEEYNPLYVSQLAAALDAAGEHERALPVHQRAVAMTEGGLHQSHSLILHHEMRGAFDEAITIADRLLAEHPEVLWLPKLRRRLRRKKRHTHWLGLLAHRLCLDPVLDRVLR
jgi:tetratricopeptide (TPR) repeat protein